jgi:hypothetical protein
MRIDLHIGFSEAGADALQAAMAEKREQLLRQGILFPAALGKKNHTRLYMAVTEPDHIDPLRFARGFLIAEKQELLRDAVKDDLARDITEHRPDKIILSATQLGSSLWRPSELERLRTLLATFSKDIRVIAHVDEPARVLAAHYASQIFEGRTAPLSRELDLLEKEQWWEACLATMPEIRPDQAQFEENQGAPFWLDYARLISHWEAVFGEGSMELRSFDHGAGSDTAAADEICQAFSLEDPLGRVRAPGSDEAPSDASLTRGRALNALLCQLLGKGDFVIPRQLWRSFLNDISVEGEPLDPAALADMSRHFDRQNKSLIKIHEGLAPDTFKRPRAKSRWTEADPTLGYRASQYLLAFMWRIEKATRQARREARKRDGDGKADRAATASPALPGTAARHFESLKNSPFTPHNRLGAVNEEELAAPFPEVARAPLQDGSSGNVIVGCMKNEAPYILEWIAYHRAIGVDNFLIYTNDCSDGTSELLDRLDDLGIVQHRNNDAWKGNSPQQYALNQALKEPVIRDADWIIHIDVDEFMNIRCGNGTLNDFFDRVPGATNVAMTWRLFGHNGVTRLSDHLVIEQFDTCAPKYCPKPHTAWGFKTMFRNIGAYAKISCHRPNKLDDGMRAQVKWVNGSGADMTSEVLDNGWRNSKNSIGYDLIQLNHYALRSAESFLIKRQRGRALHVDRSIGLNYWVRMDWCNFRDITIKRNIPRVQAELARLKEDAQTLALHQAGLDWHRAKADELRAHPEFAELFEQAIALKLTETERAAYALALDMES